VDGRHEHGQKQLHVVGIMTVFHNMTADKPNLTDYYVSGKKATV